MHTHQMIATHPLSQGAPTGVLIRAIEECYDCSQACTTCADACMAEARVDTLVSCIRACLDCADVCIACGQTSSRSTGASHHLTIRMLATCAEACRMCAEECERHAEHMEHCAVCAEACRNCERACSEAVLSLTPRIQ